MKKIKLISLLLPLIAMSLGGCKDKEESKEPASEPATSEVVPSEPSEPSEPVEPTVVYTAEGVMQDIGTAVWGSVEEGDFADADASGVVESNYTIGWTVETPEDSEECLNGVLNELVGILPSYLSVVQGPTYTAGAITSVTPALGVSELYTITEDEAIVAYFYNYCYNSKVSIVFMAGPVSAFMN